MGAIERSDPWFWISVVSITGWLFFLFHDLPTNYWRIPRDLRRRIDMVIGRLFVIKADNDEESDRAFQIQDRNRFFEIASEVLLRNLAEQECRSRGVPPEVFSARRGGRFDA